MHIKESVMLGDKELSFETGKLAKQADGAVLIRYGDSVVLVTAVASKTAREGVDFLPLTCEYVEKTYGAGKIPGGYFKREGRPTEAEILVARLLDRPSRPLFPKGFRFETQIIAMALSYDKENPTDVLAMTGAAAALHLSSIPWAGPFVGVRVGRVNEQFVINPTFQQREKSDLDFVVAVSRDAIVMVEGGADQISEEMTVDALFFAHQAAQPVLDLIEKLRAAVGLHQGFAQRHERAVWLGVSTALSPIAAAYIEPDAAVPLYHVAAGVLVLMAVMTNITAIWRIRVVMRGLSGRAAGSKPARVSKETAAPAPADLTPQPTHS